MTLKDAKTVSLTKQHMEVYTKHKNAFAAASKTAKRKVFLEFLANKKELDLVGNLSDYACNVHNWDLPPSDYKSFFRYFIYETLVAKTYNCLNRLSEIATNIEQKFISEFGDQNYKYHMVKSLTNYYKTKVMIWGVDYQIDTKTSSPVNIQFSSSKKLYDILDDFLIPYLNLSKQGEFVPDETLLDKGIINQQDYLKRFSQKFLTYKTMILENSSNPVASTEVHDYFPEMIILGVKSYLTFEDMPKEDKEMFESFRAENGDETLQAFDFYFIGNETLNIDACIRLDNLFV